MKLIVLTGQTFSRLTVIGPAYSVGGKRQWLCACVCGEKPTVAGDCLRRGATQSCGCLLRERAKETRTASNLSHGHSRTRTHVTWKSMKARCSNPKSVQWRWYGGAGVTVCSRWADSFENFLADMGERPEGMTLDRFPNNRGNYEPGNCRWATPKQQADNRKSVRSAAN